VVDDYQSYASIMYLSYKTIHANVSSLCERLGCYQCPRPPPAFLLGALLLTFRS